MQLVMSCMAYLKRSKRREFIRMVALHWDNCWVWQRKVQPFLVYLSCTYRQQYPILQPFWRSKAFLAIRTKPWHTLKSLITPPAKIPATQAAMPMRPA